MPNTKQFQEVMNKHLHPCMTSILSLLKQEALPSTIMLYIYRYKEATYFQVHLYLPNMFVIAHRDDLSFSLMQEKYNSYLVKHNIKDEQLRTLIKEIQNIIYYSPIMNKQSDNRAVSVAYDLTSDSFEFLNIEQARSMVSRLNNA